MIFEKQAAISFRHSSSKTGSVWTSWYIRPVVKFCFASISLCLLRLIGYLVLRSSIDSPNMVSMVFAFFCSREGLEDCQASKISTHRLFRPFEKILKKYMSARLSSEQT